MTGLAVVHGGAGTQISVHQVGNVSLYRYQSLVMLKNCLSEKMIYKYGKKCIVSVFVRPHLYFTGV